MNKVLLGLLAGSITLVANLPAFADSVQTTTETVQSPPQVINSYMKPTVTQTKTITGSDGTVRTDTAPMIMERHEQVVMPTSEVQTTTTTTDPKVITEETSKQVSHVAYHKRLVKHHRIAHKPVKHVVAYRHRNANKAIAVNVRKTTIVQPQVIEQTQTIKHDDMVIDRKDPALDNN